MLVGAFLANYASMNADITASAKPAVVYSHKSIDVSEKLPPIFEESVLNRDIDASSYSIAPRERNTSVLKYNEFTLPKYDAKKLFQMEVQAPEVMNSKGDIARGIARKYLPESPFLAVALKKRVSLGKNYDSQNNNELAYGIKGSGLSIGGKIFPQEIPIGLEAEIVLGNRTRISIPFRAFGGNGAIRYSIKNAAWSLGYHLSK